MKLKIIAYSLLFILMLSGCSVAENSISSDASELSIDYSRVVNSLPGHDDNVYEKPENLLGVTVEPTRLVGKYDKEKLSKKYETLAKEVYILYLFEHEDKTASQMYRYYFFDSKESYDKAYEDFCLTNGSPSVKNEQSLFFGNGGSAELYVSGRPTYSDIALYYQANSIEVIYSWDEIEESVEEVSSDISQENVASNDN